MKKSHLTQKVELKVTLTTIGVTTVCLLPLMALLHGLRERQGIIDHIPSVFNLLSRLWVQLVLVITFRSLYTAQNLLFSGDFTKRLMY